MGLRGINVASAVGDISLKGDYDASTNTPDLDTSPSGVKKGDHYVVSVAGTFFSTALEVGDSIIAKKDSPTLVTDWIILQANLTAATIKTAYESNANTNEFDDAEQTKLAGIETAATADQTDAEIETAYNAQVAIVTQLDAEAGIATVRKGWTAQRVKQAIDALTAAAGDVTLKGDYDASTNTPDLDTAPSGIIKGDLYVVSVAGTFFSTALEVGDSIIAKQTDPTTISHWILIQANLTDASIKTAYEANANTNEFDDAEQTKLAGIETAATADQTNAEIKTAYEANANTNEFDDAEQTKLAGIETAATADQTNAEIKTAYESNANTNEFDDAEQTKLAGIATGAIANVVEDTTPELGGNLDCLGKDLDNIQNLIHDQSVSGIDIDFSEDEVQTISIAANTTFTTANRAIGKSKTLKITTDATLRTLDFPAWKFVGAKPADQAASKVGILTLTCFGTADTDIVAAYAVQE